MALSQKLLLLEQKGQIFILTLQNGEDNKLSLALCREIMAALDYIREQLGSESEGALIIQGNNPKFFTNGINLEEAALNPEISKDGFIPLLYELLDFPFPIIGLITGHTFGGGCPFSLCFDYRIMNSQRGFWCMVAVDLGLYFPGIGSLVKAKLSPHVARKVLLEGHRFTGKEALADDIVDAIASPESMFQVALDQAEKWKVKACKGVYGSLRAELLLEPRQRLKASSNIHKDLDHPAMLPRRAKI